MEPPDPHQIADALREQLRLLRALIENWLQFLWNVNAVGGDKSVMSDLQALYLGACDGSSCANVNVSRANLSASAESHFGIASARSQYFKNSGTNFGVDELANP